MGLFGGFASVVEWEEYRDDVIFWLWKDREIKKKSRLILKPGQEAIFIQDGKIAGIFTDEGSFNIQSDIIPLFSALKGVKFGFKSGRRSQIMFVNKREITMQWGTKNPIMVPCPSVPGGVPIRGFGTYVLKVDDLMAMVDSFAGVREIYTAQDARERVDAVLDQLLMKWISAEGKDLTNLQANSAQICSGICTDLDMEMLKIGMTVSNFRASSFTYPKELQSLLMQTAVSGISRPASAANLYHAAPAMTSAKLYCANCGAKLTSGAKFCASCGHTVA